jgi:potassium efflux system protein
MALTVLMMIVGRPAAALAWQQESEDMWMPVPGAYFHVPQEQCHPFQLAFHIAELPAVHDDASPAGPLHAPGEARDRPGMLSAPIALVNYEAPVATAIDDDPAKPAAVASPAKVPLDWNWAPAADAIVDQNMLEQLAASVEKVRGSIAEEASEQGKVDASAKLDVAAERLDAARKFFVKIGERQAETTSAPEVLQKLEADKSVPLPTIPVSIDTTQSLDAHQVTLAEYLQKEQKLRDEMAIVDARIKERSDSREAIPRKRVAANERLTAATKTIAEQTAAEKPDQALLVENQAIAMACLLELRLLEADQAWVIATERIGVVRKDQLKRKLENAVASTKAMQALIDDFRKQLALAEEEKARRKAAQAHPRVAALATRNADLAEERSRIAGLIQSDKAELAELETQIKDLDATKSRLDKHLEKAKYSQSVGILLRFQRAKLPQTKRHRERASAINIAFPTQALKQLDIEEQIEGFDQEEAVLHEEIASEVGKESSITTGQLLRMADELMETRKSYLTELNSDYESYMTGLAELRTAHEMCIAKINSLRLFIDQHVLWIRSAPPLDSTDFQKSLSAIHSIGANSRWQELASGLGSRLVTRWPVLLMVGVALWLAIGMRRQLNFRLRQVSRRRSDMRFSPILRSLTMTLLQASFLAVLVATLGWLLSDPWQSGSIKDAISRGLLAIAPQLFIGSVIYRFCMRGGLAEAQLGWIPAITTVIRNSAGRINRYCLPLFAVSRMLEVLDEGRWSDSLGRLVFMGVMVTFSWVTFRLLRGIGKCWKADPSASKSVWVHSFGLWAPLFVLAPLALTGLAALGYQYSAVFLAGRLLLTWWTLLGVV